MHDPGTRYVTALAAKDTAALLELLAPDVDFRGMTPGRFWEATSAQQVVHDVLYRWFDDTDVIERVEHVETGTVVDRRRVDYRLRVSNPDGDHAVEQHAYFDVDGAGRIVRMHVMCAGYRPLTAAPDAPAAQAPAAQAPAAQAPVPAAKAGATAHRPQPPATAARPAAAPAPRAPGD